MRGCLILSLLALAGCGEHMGWNPNYNFGHSRYGTYRATREAALVTNAEAPSSIPVARPFYAPTGAEIAGRSPVPAPATMGVERVRIVKTAQTAPVRPGPAQVVKEHAVPAQAIPAQSVPAQSVPAQVAPVQAVPAQVAPVQAAPVGAAARRSGNAPIVIVPPSMQGAAAGQPPL